MKRKTRKPEAYCMFGFMKSDPDVTGWLSFTRGTSRRTYEIVDDMSQAEVFPSKPGKRQKDFGTPEQWEEFFRHDPELADWRFHLVAIKLRRNHRD